MIIVKDYDVLKILIFVSLSSKVFKLKEDKMNSYVWDIELVCLVWIFESKNDVQKYLKIYKVNGLE